MSEPQSRAASQGDATPRAGRAVADDDVKSTLGFWHCEACGFNNHWQNERPWTCRQCGTADPVWLASRAAQATPAEGAARGDWLRAHLPQGEGPGAALDRLQRPAGAADRTRGAGWYVITADGGHRGPFASESDAMADAAEGERVCSWRPTSPEAAAEERLRGEARMWREIACPFIEWAQSNTVLDSGKWAGFSVFDGVRAEFEATRQRVAALEQECATLREDAAIGALARAWWEDRREQPVSYLTMCKEYTALIVALDAARAGRPAGED
jgi:hypothetical protein